MCVVTVRCMGSQPSVAMRLYTPHSPCSIAARSGGRGECGAGEMCAITVRCMGITAIRCDAPVYAALALIRRLANQGAPARNQRGRATNEGECGVQTRTVTHTCGPMHLALPCRSRQRHTRPYRKMHGGCPIGEPPCTGDQEVGPVRSRGSGQAVRRRLMARPATRISATAPRPA